MAPVRTNSDRATLLLVCASFITRLMVYFALSRFDSNFYSGSLSEAYLFPRLSVQPWQVDWSYGPLTYLAYWGMLQTPFASILARICNFLTDSISVYLIIAISARFVSRPRSLLAASFWAFASPVLWASIFVSTDSIPVTATLGAVYFALAGKTKWSVLLVGVGFSLKWYPILILPLILRAHLPKRNPLRLVVLSISPFALTGLLTIANSYISGVTVTNQLELTLHNFSSRVPAGPSIWNLLQALYSTQPSYGRIPSVAIYFVMLIALITLSLRSSVSSGFQFLGRSTNILFVLINIASQIQGNYLLWYYPLILIVILKEQMGARLFAKLSLLVSCFVFNYLFIYPRLGIISRGPTALIASPRAYDILSIVAYQASVWLLFYLLRRPEGAGRNIKQDSVAAIRT